MIAVLEAACRLYTPYSVLIWTAKLSAHKVESSNVLLRTRHAMPVSCWWEFTLELPLLLWFLMKVKYFSDFRSSIYTNVYSSCITSTAAWLRAPRNIQRCYCMKQHSWFDRCYVSHASNVVRLITKVLFLHFIHVTATVCRFPCWHRVTFQMNVFIWLNRGFTLISRVGKV